MLPNTLEFLHQRSNLVKWPELDTLKSCLWVLMLQLHSNMRLLLPLFFPFSVSVLYLLSSSSLADSCCLCGRKNHMLAGFLASVPAFSPSKPLRPCPALSLWSCSDDNKPSYGFIMLCHDETGFLSYTANIW